MNRLTLIFALIASLVVAAMSVTRSAAADPQANLAITLTAAPNPVIAGDRIEYGVTVTNTGPAQAVNVETVLTIPSTTSVISVTPALPCGRTPTVITCTASLLNMGDSLSYTLVVAVAPDARGTIVTRGSVRSSIADPNQNNNSQSLQTTVNTQIDLGLTNVGPTNAPAIAGEPLIYQLQVSNSGRSTASQAQLTAQLPTAKFAGFLSASPGLICTPASGSVTCALGTVAPAPLQSTNWITSGTVLTMAVRPKPTLTSADTLLNTFSISAVEPEASTNNNFTSFLLGVNRHSDLGVTITPSQSAIQSSQPITYTITAVNAGPSENTGVVLTTTLALDHLTNPVITGANCQSQASGLVCTFGTMAAGATQTVTVHGTLFWVLAEPFSVEAGIRGDNAEAANVLPNTASITTQVEARRLYMPFISHTSR